MPPFLPMLLAALALPLCPLVIRRALCVAAPASALTLAIGAELGSSYSFPFLGIDIVLMRCDPLSRIFGMVFAVAALAANIYGWHRQRVSEQAAASLYAGGGIAVVFAGDLLSMLVAWEVMAVASAILVFGGGNEHSIGAGQRYLLVHLVAGGLLLLGIAGILAGGGSLEFGALRADDWPTYAILAAFCINAAVVPMHAWLPDAYPEADVAGSVFLSTFTTKAAVYCLVRGFAGNEILIWAGAIMAVYGVVFATMEDDMRRLLSYHIVSQVGYMVCGVGIGTDLALNGTVAHAVCHILYKALLFMAVGAVIFRTGRSRLSELGGLYRFMPAALGLYMVGALSISGAPLFNGFVSKSLVVSGVGEVHHTAAMFLLTLASVGTFLSVGLKLPYFAWISAPQSKHPTDDASPSGPKDAPGHMVAAMAMLAALCIGIGIFPGALYEWLPYPPVDYHPYSAYHVFDMLLVMAFCGLAFWQLRDRLTPHRGVTLDLDRLYRRPAEWTISGLSVPLDRSADALGSVISGWRDALAAWSRDPTNAPWTDPDPDRTWFDPEVKRPPVGQSLALVLGTLLLCAALLIVFS